MQSPILYEIKLSHGRMFRVYCANKSQINRLHRTLQKHIGCEYTAHELSKGIHTIKQFEDIAPTL
jgi:hypothetical protein